MADDGSIQRKQETEVNQNQEEQRPVIRTPQTDDQDPGESTRRQNDGI